MPWKIEKQGEQFCVVKESDGSVEKCHDTQADAEAHMKAMYASESKAQDAAPVVDEKALLERIWDGIQSRLGRKQDDATGFKVVGNHYLTVWSNDFKDRDQEIFTRKAIDDYVDRVDLGIVPLPELWVWHIPGTRIGQAEKVARHGHFVLSWGAFDDNEYGYAARDYYAKHAHEKGISHGYRYSASDFDGKHYHSFNTFENSPLPLGAEANLFTSLEGVKAIKMDEKKQQELEAIFGKDRTQAILANLDKRGKALEDLEVEFKDFTAPNPATPTPDAHKEAVDHADKAFSDMLSEVLESSAEPITAALEAVKAVKTMRDENVALRKELMQAVAALNERLDGAPRRASKDIKTRLAKDDPAAVLLDKSIEQERLEGSKVLGGLFANGNTPD
jgi:hypothetical protein